MEGGVEDSSEGWRQPEVEEPVPEDRYRGLGARPEYGEGGEHRRLEDTYASRGERYRRDGDRYSVGHEKNKGIGRHVHGREQEDQAQGVEGPAARRLHREGRHLHGSSNKPPTFRPKLFPAPRHQPSGPYLRLSL
jgi:hypothetical protein